MIRLFITAFSLLMCTQLFASPSAAIWHTETIVGASEDVYFVLQNVRNTGNTYYNYTDSVFLTKRNLQDGENDKRILLRVIEHIDSTANGDWTITETTIRKVNIQSYLVRENAYPIFPSYLEENVHFLIDEHGILREWSSNVNEQYTLKYLADRKTLAKRIAYYMYEAEYSPQRVIMTQESANHYFIMVEHGDKMSDTDYYQSFLIVQKDEIH